VIDIPDIVPTRIVHDQTQPFSAASRDGIIADGGAGQSSGSSSFSIL
jgi:hypothetical protein